MVKTVDSIYPNVKVKLQNSNKYSQNGEKSNMHSNSSENLETPSTKETNIDNITISNFSEHKTRPKQIFTDRAKLVQQNNSCFLEFNKKKHFHKQHNTLDLFGPLTQRKNQNHIPKKYKR